MVIEQFGRAGASIQVYCKQRSFSVRRDKKMKDVWVRAKLLQLCVTLCDPVNCNLPGSSVHGILQARILE